MNISNPWMVSLHGGHTGEFCDHGHGTLREAIEAAAEFGYHTFGVAEHAPRSEARFLFPEEIARGWDVAKIHDDFDRYARSLAELADEFKERLTVLRGFEAEMVPRNSYRAHVLALREKYNFDYIVASVHWVGETIIDYNQAEYRRALASYGGTEALHAAYYDALAEMVEALHPEVAGHFDVIRKFAAPEEPYDAPAVRKAAQHALTVVKACGAILDINAAPYRKGRNEPYPGEWLIDNVREMSIPVCFGDDSHGPRDVGGGITQARDFLLRHGIKEIVYLKRDGGRLAQQPAALE